MADKEERNKNVSKSTRVEATTGEDAAVDSSPATTAAGPAVGDLSSNSVMLQDEVRTPGTAKSLLGRRNGGNNLYIKIPTPQRREEDEEDEGSQ